MKSFILSHHPENPTGSRMVRRVRKGFSILEVAIAMGVVTLLLTTFLGVFGPAQKNIQRSLSTKDANRMKDALSNEMSILRVSNTADDSSFEKAYRMITDSYDETKAVLLYQYKADPTADPDEDGIFDAYTGADGIQGRDYIVETAVRSIGVDDTLIQAELAPKVVEGPVFVVRMSQLVADTNGLVARSAAGIVDPDSGATVTDADAYPKAVIAFRAEFFKLNVNKHAYVTGGSWDLNEMGNAVTEVNMAVRR